MNDFLKRNQAVITISLILNLVFFVAIVLLLYASFGPSLFTSGFDREQTQASEVYVPQGREETLVIETVEEANPAVVSIVATAEVPSLTPREREFLRFFAPFLDIPEGDGESERQVGGGSGFFVSPDGLVVTNRHVVANDDVQYAIVTEDGDQFPATVVAKDPTYDIAILQANVDEVNYLTFGDSDGLRLGQTVVAIGNVLAQFSHSISEGIISGLSRSIRATDRTGRSELLQGVIQTDAAINPGNSGGPLLNLNGEVVGVNVAVAIDSENIGFALPSNVVSQIVDSVRETGEIIRPYVGVWYREVTPELAEEQGLSVEHGIIVTEGQGGQGGVIEGSPADDVGIQVGDIILSIDGQDIGRDIVFSAEIRKRRVGDTVTLTILRDGTEREVDVTLERAPDSLE